MIPTPDIRLLIIDWVGAHQTIDPHPVRLGGLAAVANGQPLTIT